MTRSSVVLGVASVLVSVACQPTSTGPEVLPPRVHLVFDGAPRPDGTRVTSINDHGTADVAVAIVSRDGGIVVSSTPRPGAEGRAIRLPAFDPTAPAPRAVVRVTNSGATDELDPNTEALTMGADFALDASSAQVGSAVDDGNNLLQRGLWGERSQVKLEVDGGRVGCRIKGSTGEVTVIGDVQVQAGRWYRTSCRRDGDTVTLTLGSWDTSGTMAVRSWSERGATGDLSPATPAVPLSIGGKLEPSGTITSATDQFNGRVDNVFLTIG